jgi:uncharacterized membrane protein YccF (DUF307 family)
MIMSAANPEPALTYDYSKGPGCLVRGLWFIFIGLWLGGIWCWIAWILNITIIGMPLGLWMLNRIPQVMTLKPVRTVSTVSTVDGRVVITHRNPKQIFFLWRAIYFILIGWWFSLIWLFFAWLVTGITLGLGLPLAFWMFDRVPGITTLQK